MTVEGQFLAECTGGEWIYGIPTAVNEIVFDSRLIEQDKKQVFIAMTHGGRDGHDFVDSAISAGALACIVERKMDRSCPQLIVPNTLNALSDIGRIIRERYEGTVIGITGSCGKTSTKGLLKYALGREVTFAKEGNWNNKMGVPLTLFDLHNSASRYAVIEAGISECDEMSELSAMIQPDLCLITNIGEAHLEGLGNLQVVAEEKSKIMEFSKEGARLVTAESVLHYKVFDAYKEGITCVCPLSEKDRVSDEASYFYDYECLNTGTSKVHVRHLNRSVEFEVQSLSPGMIQNAVLALATAGTLGLELESVAKRLESWKPEMNRGSILNQGGVLFYNDCYNANPTSMLDALSSFRVVAKNHKHKLYVLGTMNELGEEAESLHRAVAREIEPNPNDQMVFVGSKSLTSAYLEGAKLAGWEESSLQCVESVKYLKSMVEQFSGAVFLKGSRVCRLETLIPETD